MTDQVYDDRARSYIEARERLDQAQKIKRAVLRSPDQLPEEYWSLIAEADVFAKLATADAGAGFMAGNWLVERDRKDRKRRQRENIDEFMSNAKRSKALKEPFAQGHRVRVTAGDYEGRTGNVLTTTWSKNQPATAELGLDPDGALVTVTFDDLELIGVDE